MVRIEHWDVAMDQGRLAALNMLKKSIPYVAKQRKGGGSLALGSTELPQMDSAAASPPRAPPLPTRYNCVPFFWTQQYGKSLRYAGHAYAFDDVVIQGQVDGDKPSFTVFYCQGQTVR